MKKLRIQMIFKNLRQFFKEVIFLLFYKRRAIKFVKEIIKLSLKEVVINRLTYSENLLIIHYKDEFSKLEHIIPANYKVTLRYNSHGKMLLQLVAFYDEDLHDFIVPKVLAIPHKFTSIDPINNVINVELWLDQK